MMRLSLSTAWDDTKTVLRRDGGALVAIALALLVLPGAIAELATPNVPTGQQAEPGWWSLLTFLAMLIGLAGQIAITRIALGQQGTVGQAIGWGFRRLPVLLAALIIWVLPFAILFVLIGMAAGGGAPGEVPANPAALVALLPVLLVFFYLLFRFLLVTAVVTAEPIGPVAALKRSWSLTHGQVGKLFLALLLIAIVATIALGAVQFAVGSIIVLLAGAPEQWSVSDLLLVLLTQLLGAVFSVIFACLVASFYRQRTGSEQHAAASVPSAGEH